VRGKQDSTTAGENASLPGENSKAVKNKKLTAEAQRKRRDFAEKT
jgi:hypothetical protein